METIRCSCETPDPERSRSGINPSPIQACYTGLRKSARLKRDFLALRRQSLETTADNQVERVAGPDRDACPAFKREQLRFRIDQMLRELLDERFAMGGSHSGLDALLVELTNE